MALTSEIRWDEGPISFRKGEGGKATLRVIVTSDDPSTEGRAEVLEYLRTSVDIPDEINGLFPRDFKVLDRIRDEPYDARWNCEVEYESAEGNYGNPGPLSSAGQVRITIRSGNGGSENRIISEEIIAEAADADEFKWIAIPEVKNLIGFEAEPKDEASTMFSVTGVPIASSAVEVTVETLMLNSYWAATSGILLTAEAAGNSVVNQNAWRYFPIRSLRLDSFEATQRVSEPGQDPDLNENDWDVRYSFEFKPTVTLPDSAYGGLTARFPGPKYGHDYLDRLFVPAEIPIGGTGFVVTVPKLKRLAIHRIYEQVDFATVLKI